MSGVLDRSLASDWKATTSPSVVCTGKVDAPSPVRFGLTAVTLMAAVVWVCTSRWKMSAALFLSISPLTRLVPVLVKTTCRPSGVIW